MELHKLLSTDYMLESEHNALMMNKRVQLDALRTAYKKLIHTFGHDHVRMQDSDDKDTCARCGLDIRNDIHRRVGKASA